MSRFMLIALVTAPLAFGIAGCKKAHDAGNDSMHAPGGAITATNVQSGAAHAMPVASSSSAAARDAVSSGVSQ